MDIQELIDFVDALDSEVYRSANCHQFTIDLVEECLEELDDYKETDNFAIIGSLCYTVDTALEIMNISLPDFDILSRLHKCLSDYNNEK